MGAGLRIQIIIALVGAFLLAFLIVGIADARLDHHAKQSAALRYAGGLALLLSEGSKGTRNIQDLVERSHLLCAADPELAIAFRERESQSISAICGNRGSEDPTVSVNVDASKSLLIWIRSNEYSGSLMSNPIVLYGTTTALFFCVIVYALLTRWVIRPVEKLETATREISGGVFSTRVVIRGASELVSLSRSFNRMAQQLEEDRKELNDQLEQLQAQQKALESAEEQVIRSARLAAVGQLAAGVAHEIGNPLSAIKGLADLLEDESIAPGERAEFIARIQNESERIHRIIRSLLDFSRHDAPTDASTTADLIETIEDVITLVSNEPRFRRVMFEKSFHASSIHVRGSKDKITQVLMNVFFNAVDAMEGVGKLCIVTRIHEESAHLVCEISDDGPGVPLEIVETIFDPFVTTKPSGKGTGLGLSVCHTVMERLGGSISLRNLPEGGACVELNFVSA